MDSHVLRRWLSESHGFATVLAAVLLVVNVAYLPRMANPDQWHLVLGQMAPLVLVAMATMPSVVSGGLDLSIGPLVNFVAILFCQTLLPHGLGSVWISLPLCLGVGALVGALNGLIVAVLRYQPIIATLATFIILSGVNVILAPTSIAAPANWTSHLAGELLLVPGGLVVLLLVALVWHLLGRTAFRRSLYAAGGDAVAAYSAGLSVTKVRIAAYALGGAIAGLAGLTLVGLVQGIDANYGQPYALVGIAAVALGGVSLRGGRGTLLGAAMGALAIYLVQNVMLAAHINILWVQVVYGSFLIIGVVAGGLLGRLTTKAVPA